MDGLPLHHHHDDHHHHHDHVHHHDHPHDHRSPRTLSLELALLAGNDERARRNRAWLDARRVFALNLIGSPGAGKTALIEALIRRSRHAVSVLEGDQETDFDAARIRATGARAVQINTGPGCHLDAEMVHAGLEKLAPPERSLVLIENVGNLVCPALFDLGEHVKAVALSVTEGEEKPLKYPHVFLAAQALILTKIDLLPHLRFDVARCLANARRVNPALRVFGVSTATGEGLEVLAAWLDRQHHEGVEAR